MSYTVPTSEFTISRSFDASRDLVWKAWSEPDRLNKWWGPKGLGLEVVTLHFQPGGLFHYAMVMPGGQKMWGRFIYGDITAPSQLMFINSFADEQGSVIRAPFSPVWPLEVENTLTLEEEGPSRTKLTLRGYPINASELEVQTFIAGHASMQAGFGGTLDQLDAYLKKRC
jgi:uncharacterized protein YndB with AHSA1/START domain